MNQNFSTSLKNIVFYILLPLGVAKLLWSGALLFLDKDAISEVKGADYHYHYNINLARQIIKTGGPIAVQPVETHERIKDIKLKGTYNSGNKSFIVLEDNLGTTFLYSGEKYVGYKLLEIYDERAVLEKNGINYELIMEDEENKGGSGHNVPQSTNTPTSAGTSFVPGQPTKITRNELDSYIQDPNKIWKNIRIQELRRDGELNGFRVNYVKKKSFFEQAGLKTGDVITAVDGKELKSLADVMEYYTNVDTLEALSLRVKRGDEEIDLEFNVN